VSVDNHGYNVRLTVWRQTCQSDEHDSRRQETLTEHQVAKVKIGRQQGRILAVRYVEHDIIRYARLHLGNIYNVMSINAQALYDLTVDALVCHNLQGVVPTKGYTTSARKASAAKARAARIASRLNRGWASMICSMVSPATSFSRISSAVQL